MSKRCSMIGQKFGHLLVLEEAPRNSSGKIRWLCQCDCGNTRIVIGSLLRTGHVISCGCIKSSKQRLYQIWADIKQRCYNENCKAYRFYGAKGITLCDEWHDFSVFKEWALSSGYADSLTIDRIDNKNNYCPSNCRWLSRKENSMEGLNNYFKSSLSSGKFSSLDDILYVLLHPEMSSKELAAHIHKCKNTVNNIRNHRYMKCVLKTIV